MTVASWIGDKEVIDAIKDILQAQLTDPRAQYTNDSRFWVHTDEPLPSATYPRITVSKRGPTTTEIISIGQDFIEWRAIILDITFWSKDPFSWKDSSNIYYKNEELVKKYLDTIWKTLKTQQSTLHTTYGITGLRPMSEAIPFHNPETQLYMGTISVRVWYFRKT